MSRREKLLALLVALIVGGFALLNWVIDPALAAFAAIDAESEQLEQELIQARGLVEDEPRIRKDWAGYQKAGLKRSLEAADAETGRALLVWAEDARLTKVRLSDGKPKTDGEQPFATLSYTLQAAGRLSQVCELFYAVLESPFPLRIEKCVIDVQNNDSESLQLSLTVSTLFTPEAKP
ncbi:MAG: hypothetical protein ACE37H_12180 [Phycisphaeraceae bacterium]